MRVQPDWSNVEVAWENLDVSLGRLTGLLARLNESAGWRGSGDDEELLTEVSGVLQESQRLRAGIASVLARDDAETIAWLVYARSSGSITLCAAPLQVAEALRARLFADRETAVLTGATLSVAGSFDYVCHAVGLEEPRRAPARLALRLRPLDAPARPVNDVPEPNQRRLPGRAGARARRPLPRQRRAGARPVHVLRLSAAPPTPPSSDTSSSEGILVLGQGIDGSPKSLLNALRENTRTVILGTSSFWEGVDVAGEALSLLVIARLPFSVPDGPGVRRSLRALRGPFQEYALPQAVIRFKQGFGRLIRRKTDRGVVVVMDRRLRSKAYGASFLRSLPPCSDADLPLRELPVAVTAWLERNEAARMPPSP